MLQMNARDHPFWQQTHDSEVDAADKGQARQNAIDVLGYVTSRPDPGYESSILPHVVRKLGGIENNAHIEKRKKDDERNVNQRIERLAPLDLIRKLFKERRLLLKKQRQSLRKSEQRTRENRRDHAAGVHAQGQIGHLSAHYLAPHHAFGVLHGYAPLATFHKHDKGDHR